MKHQRFFIVFILMAVVGALMFAPQPTQAAGTVTTCSEAALDTALTGGGVVDFNIGAPCTFVFTATKAIASGTTTIQNTSGFSVVLDGNNSVRLFTVSAGATLNLSNLTVLQGRAATGNGGAIDTAGTLNITGVTFSNNTTANGSGGAIINTGSLTIDSSIFISNVANGTGQAGGAIFHNTPGSMIVRNSTFANNSSASDGGAIRTRNTATLTHNTFYNNTTGIVGGGHVRNSMGTTTFGANLFVDGTCVNGTNVNAGNNIAFNSAGCLGAGTDPMGSFSGNIYTPTNDAIEYAPACALANDQLGVARPSGTNCTPGAIEILGSVSTVTLNVSAACIGNDLQVTIIAGDNPFQITADSGTLLTGLGVGVHTITGPVIETNINVTELAGDTENFPLGNIICVASSTLTASAVCNGADLEVTISNGDSPFTVNVTTTSGVLSLGSVVLGTYGFTGPDTFSNISVVEESGDTETLNLPSVTCTATTPPIVPVVPVAVVLSPDLNALGCELTSHIDIANAPDNTYCRILMKDGAVIGYSGAVPADLISLGVIFAVDVYRLEGGTSVTTFPDYTRICLNGAGRLFYMDSRNAPRGIIELTTEAEGNLTCGWIPAPGTLILTN